MTTKKPLPKAYPKELVSLGDHLRKRRFDLKLQQTEVATMMNVDEMTIVGWELNHCQPLARHIPRIVNFLGYVAEDLFPANTLGQKIIRYRLLHGMTKKQVAKQLRIDETTLDRLEIDKGRHLPKTMKKVAGLLSSLNH